MAAEKILIIDDSPIDARFASKLLTEAGYQTTIVHDSLEALGTARELRPDLILLDVTMPKMDGYQVCRQLKADPQTRNIPTVLYTIRDQFIDCLRGIEAGADDFIIKSLSGEDFLNRVKRILSEWEIGLGSSVEGVDLELLKPLREIEDRKALVNALYSAFNKHVRETMNVFLGSHVTSVLVDRAIEKVAAEHPFFRRLDSSQLMGLLLDPQVTEETSSEEIIKAFVAFNRELIQLVTKLTRTRPSGPKEARGILKGVSDMVRELGIQYEDLKARAVLPPSTEEAVPLPVAEPAPVAISEPMNADCTIDGQGHLIYANDDLVRVLGYSKEELLGRRISELVDEPSRPMLSRALDQVRDKGSGATKLILRSKSGGIVHAEARMTALYDAQGQFAMTRCNLLIIPTTQLLQERDREVERLKHALQEMSEEFGVLASTISHDLRQPLHAILVLCQFLRDEYLHQLDEQAQGYIRSIEQAGTRMKEMIEDLVHYARITSATNAYEGVPLDALLGQVRDELSEMIQQRNVRLQVMGELPTVTCDRERIKELFKELITNAIKFNDQAEPRVEIALAKVDPEGYTFSVKDNGIGIEETEHENVFRLFYRLHKPEEYGGTGAGLAICRRIVEAHGGKIWVRSRPGEGTTVLFTLPRELPTA